MNPEQFSFSKKPVYSNHKRHSVISDIIPADNSSGNSNNYTTTKEQRTNSKNSSHRTFSSTSDLTNQIRTNSGSLLKPYSSPDDPLLDYDEQIRAPKFQSKKSLDDIGSVSAKFELNDLMDKSSKSNRNKQRRDGSDSSGSQNGLSMSTLEATGNNAANNNKQQQQDQLGTRPTYQPATLDMSRFSSSPLPKPTTSSSLGGGTGAYNLENYFNSSSSNVILNHMPSATITKNTTHVQRTTTDNLTNELQPTTAQTSPLSSKKNSNESIYQFTSKNIPKFSMAPLRPINDPKTPNYLPCVLRPSTTNLSTTSSNGGGMYDSTTYDMTDDYTTPTSATFDSNLSHDHWKPNNAAANCSDCQRPFSLMNRRHHCRKCGEIFCSNCLLSKAKLSYQCYFQLDGILSKVCFGCGKDWSKFLIENFKQVDKTLFPDSLKKNRSRGDVITSEADHHQEQFQQQQQQAVGDGKLEGSAVPADWSWSSF